MMARYVILAACLLVVCSVSFTDGPPTTAVPTSQPTTTSQPASQPAGGSINGKVVSEGGGRAVANAKVDVVDAQKKVIASGRSDAKGDFVLENVPAGEGYTVTAFDGGHPSGAQGFKKGVSVQASKLTEVGNITVYALPG